MQTGGLEADLERTLRLPYVHPLGVRLVYNVCTQKEVPMPARQNRTRRLNIRATPRQEKLIRLGAEQRGVTITDFIVESACLQAEHALADKRTFELSAKDWDRFVELLERPPQDKPELRKLLSEPSVLERNE